MTIAVWILTIFATVWGLFGEASTGMPTPWLALPVAISTLLLAWTLPAARTAATQLQVPNTRRTVALWSAVEIAAMVLAITLLTRLGHGDAVLPAIAMIVGAHFLPLAHGLRIPAYYATGLGLIAIGVAALALASPSREIFTGWGGAVILWGTLIFIGSRLRMLRAG